jgi:hypothetical protein
VSTWLSFVTGAAAGPVCIAITVAGLVLSGLAWRRKGARSGIRGVAWSLLPAAAWLTHSLGLVGRIVSAVVQFGGSFVLSPKAWLGVILVGISVLLFVVSGGVPLLDWRKRRDKKKVRGQAADQGRAQVAGPPPGRRSAGELTSQDDDLSDVRDILKRHGIN